MNHCKKIISITLSAVMTFGFSAFASAVSETKHPTGDIVDSWQDTISKMDATYAEAYTTYRPGDVNGDGRVSVSDARICLRTAAKLDNNGDSVIDSGDMDNDGKISVSDARSILRISAMNIPSKLNALTVLN